MTDVESAYMYLSLECSNTVVQSPCNGLVPYNKATIRMLKNV